jgi:hypothetical protein
MERISMLALPRKVESRKEIKVTKPSSALVASAFLERCLTLRSDMASQIWGKEFQPRLDASKSSLGEEDSLYILRDLSVEFVGRYAEHLMDTEIEDSGHFSKFVDAFDLFCKATENFPSLPKQLTVIKRFKKIRHLSSVLAGSISECLEKVQGTRYESEMVQFYLRVFALLWNWSQVKLYLISPQYRHKSRVVQREIKQIIEAAFFRIEQYELPYDPQSPEGKTIQRIFDDTPIEWEFVYRPDDLINVDDLDMQLRSCGYID